MDISLERELVSVTEKLSPRDKWLVVSYAKSLQTSPDLSEAGRAYLDMLRDSGASAAELARAALAVREVEQRYAQLGAEAAIRDLEYRTEAHMRVWLKERGLDYDTLTDEQLEEIVSEAVQATRHAAPDRGMP